MFAINVEGEAKFGVQATNALREWKYAAFNIEGAVGEAGKASALLCYTSNLKSATNTLPEERKNKDIATEPRLIRLIFKRNALAGRKRKLSTRRDYSQEGGCKMHLLFTGLNINQFVTMSFVAVTLSPKAESGAEKMDLA